RIIHEVPDLQPRLDIQVVADVTALHIEIEQADFFVFRLFAGLKLDGTFNGKRGASHAAAARNKGRNGRTLALRLARRSTPSAGPGNDVENFVRRILQGDPVGAPPSNQSLVVGGRYFSA